MAGTSPSGGAPADGDVLAGAAWFGDQGDGTIRRVDSSGAVGPARPGGVKSAFVLCVYDGQLWIADFGGTDVVRIDPTKPTG
jgi:streptogramin lyase